MKFKDIITQEDCVEYIKYFEQQAQKDDVQVKNSKIIRNWPKPMELCINLRSRLEEETGLTLKPHQAWIRKYKKGNILKKHIDGRADYALSITLGSSDSLSNPLLIYYEDVPTEVHLDKGDGYFFKGGTIFHERKEIQSEFIYGMYLGYLDRRATNRLI